MALTACKECNKEISTDAGSCPHCGRIRPGQSNFARAIPALVLVVAGMGWLFFVLREPEGQRADTAVLQPAAPACSASNVTVSKATVTLDGEYARLTGVIRHTCPDSAGVELKWTAFNTDGSVAFSDDFWPASVTNIPAESDYPFETMNPAPRGKWTSQVVPIGVHSW